MKAIAQINEYLFLQITFFLQFSDNFFFQLCNVKKKHQQQQIFYRTMTSIDFEMQINFISFEIRGATTTKLISIFL